MSHHGRTFVRRLAGLAAAVAGLVGAVGFPAGALAMPSETPDQTWGTNGRVSAIVQVGNTVVLGGTFTEIRDAGGAGLNVMTRSNIAAFDATTGAPLSTWAPNVNGAVYALAASPDGKKIYLGGAFTNVDGKSRGRLAALNATTGAVDTTWKPPSAAGDVLALAATGSRVYAGGWFRLLGGVTHERLGAMDATTGALDNTWAPSASTLVRGMALSPDQSRLYIGGEFVTVSGQTRLNAAALNVSDGTLVTAWHPDPGYPIFAVATNDTAVFTAGGGSANELGAWDAATGARQWTRHSDGDFQAIRVSGGVVYAGGHFDYFEGELRRKLVAVDVATGALRRAWKPIFPTGATQWGGVWALSTYQGTRLAVGGDFLTVSGIQHQHYAQFTGTIDGSAGDVDPPTTPAGLSATPLGGGTVNLSWSASTDDDAVASYDVYRGDAKIASSETTAFADTGLEPRTTYTYHVVAKDFAGHSSADSDSATATTGPPDEVVTFPVAEDAQIQAASPDKTAGTGTTVKVDADPVTDILLKFNLSGLSGRQIISAKLRLNCTDASTNGGRFSRVADNSWSEQTVTWNTAPAADPVVTDSLNDVLIGRSYDVDLTPLVRGDGTLSLRATTGSSNGAAYTSKEGGAGAPQLIVTLADPAAGTSRVPTFSDGFESGDLTRWTDVDGLSVRHGDAFSGDWTARETNTGLPTDAYKDLRATETELYTKLRFKQISTSADAAILLKLRTPGGTSSLVRLFLSGSGRLGVRNDVSETSLTSTTPLPVGTWHTAEVHAVVAGTASRIEVWLDGSKLDPLTNTDSLGTTPFGRVQLGDESTGKTYDVALDEFGLDTQRLPDTTPPSAPPGFTASAGSPFAGKVDLSWQAASDDFAVTDYRIYRDGALLATVGTSITYADTSAAPGTSYEYTIKAVDAAGNLSPASSASVTTGGSDTTPPTAPTSPAATAVSFDRIDVSWAAASDDVGVTGYRLYRDGWFLDAVGSATTRYRDATVASSKAYSYTIRAVDAAGNLSGESDAVTASTPERTLFLDGFESGDLSQWTSTAGPLTAQQGDPFAGSWAARATTTGAAAWAYKQLSSSQTEVTARLRFKFASRDSVSSIALLKLRGSTGSPLLRLYIGPSGKLAIRNDVTAVATTSTTVIATGRWYLLRLHVRIDPAGSPVDVSLDGSRIASLSLTQSLGSSPIGRVQMGDDLTGKTYDVSFDDVTVDVPPASTGAPTISGTARDGETLTADPGAWSGTDPQTNAYQWRRCDAQGGGCADIAGATEETYAVRAADVGGTLRVVVTRSNAVGSATAASDPTSVVEAAS